MNTIIKFIEREEIIKLFGEDKPNYLIGFLRKTPSYVVYCSIIKEEDGTFEYYYNCSHDFLYSIVPKNSYSTYKECYEGMMKDLKGVGNKEPSLCGITINEETYQNQRIWEMLEIKDEYPVGGFTLGNRCVIK